MDYRISLISGFVTFVVIFLVDYFAILLPKTKVINGKKIKKNKKKETTIMELEYLKNRFKLDLFKVDLDYVIKWFAFLNSFIISVTSTVIMLIPWNMIFQFMIGFVMLMGLIYSLYELYGRHLVKKGWTR